MSKFSKDLVQGLKEACAFAEGARKGSRVHVVETLDVRASGGGLSDRYRRESENYGKSFGQ